jgi:mono/diheme cytochrome c family protein
MKSRTVFTMGVALVFIVFVFWFFLKFLPSSASEKTATSMQGQIARGKYLVITVGCNDCHSPKVFTQTGPVPDSTRLLSGYPADSRLPDIPVGILGPTKWGAVTTNDLTAWVGPWGVSFAYNLTPDPGTGLGSWTEDIFIKTLRTGKVMGVSRDILPPMPWQEIGQMSDEDLKAIFAYLKSLPPVRNTIPDPIPPTDERFTKTE